MPSKKKTNAVGKTLKKAPAAQNRSSMNSRRSSLRFRESERIGTVAGSSSFAIVLDLSCNPGLPGSFPWLSGHANLYEKYRVHKLVYRFKNLKGTDTDGNILMSFDYDTLDSPPASAIEMTQSTRWIDGSPWRIFELAVPTDGRILFTRSSTPATADLKTYDMGRVFVAAEGCSDTTDHGYLEVDYDIELIDKASVSTGSPALSVALSQWNQSSSGSTSPIPFDENIVNGLSLVNTSGVISLPAGHYLVLVETATGTGGGVFELRQGGSSMTPPTKIVCGANETGSLTRYVSAASTDTIEMFFNSGPTYVADSTRLTILRL
jgi:hypothetical protein